jgi:hypothetical protein
VCNAKAPNYRKNKVFNDLAYYSEWPKVAGAVIKAVSAALKSIPPEKRNGIGLALMANLTRKRSLILADYRCGCTWVGIRAECIEYCGKHGEYRRQIITVGREGDKHIELGWDWKLPPYRLW